MVKSASFSLFCVIAIIFFSSVINNTEALVKNKAIVLSEENKHETIDSFGFEKDGQGKMTFSKVITRIEFEDKNSVNNATTASEKEVPIIYVSLCASEETNANLRSDAEKSDERAEWCEIAVKAYNESKACQFFATDSVAFLADSSLYYEKDYAPLVITAKEKKVYEIAMFTCDTKGASMITIDYNYETKNGNHHLDTAREPVVNVYLYILLTYVMIMMVQFTHTMSMCAIYRGGSVMSILHYCMWAQQLIRMVHLGVSLNHYQYIDQNGIVNGAYLYSTILCSSLNQETFWTVLLVMSCGITITSSDATKVQRYFIAVSMFFLFVVNVMLQIDLGFRVVWFLYSTTYTSVITMTLYWNSKTMQTLRTQLELFRRSGASEDEIRRAPVKLKEQMYRMYYVAYMSFVGCKILVEVFANYYERTAIWINTFANEFLEMIIWFYVLIVFRPRDRTYNSTFEANEFDPFGIGASLRAAELGVRRLDDTYVPDIYVAEIESASKIESYYVNAWRMSHQASQNVVDNGGGGGNTSSSATTSSSLSSVDSIELSALGMIPMSHNRSVTFDNDPEQQQRQETRDVELGVARRSTTSTSTNNTTTNNGKLKVFVVQNPPTRRDGLKLSESISLAIKTDEIFKILKSREAEEEAVEALAAARPRVLGELSI